MTHTVRMTPGLLLLTLVAWSGCSGSSLDTMPPPKVNNVTVTGALQGMFTATVTANYNRMSAKEETVVGIVASHPGLGIRIFSLEARLGGPPAVMHYGEREAQIIASFYLDDSRAFESTVNSLLRLDITGVSLLSSAADGSATYSMQGIAAGFAPSTESSDVINFIVTL